jgi:hypothetical protein
MKVPKIRRVTMTAWTRTWPFTRDAVLQLAVIALVPVAPVLLTMVLLEELLKRLLQIVF